MRPHSPHSISMPKILLGAALCFSLASADVALKPLHAGLAVEYGQMKGLTFFEPGGNAENFTINRTIGWISQSATIEDRMDVNLALGGLFFQFFPFNKGFDYSKVRNSAVSIGQASATYKFGEVSDPSLAVSVGLMPYKYNPDSRNLGEYLFRSTPYPNTTINGSWDLINSSYSSTKGVLVEKDLFGGKWKNDLIVSLSDEVFPLNDVNLAYVTSVRLGFLELGAGINLNNILPNSPALSTPERNFNSYFTYNGVTYFGDDLYYKQAGKFFAGEAKSLRDSKSATAADSARANQLDQIDTSYIRQGNLVDSLNRADTAGAPSRLKRDYYTFKGTLLMGRASLNLGSLISDKVDLKLYGEVDVLGWANYPIFYENRNERMPMMAGMTIPTFGLLDNLAIEVEYWKNRYPIINYKTLQNGLPIVNFDAMNSPSKSIDITKPYTSDDLKWSVSSKKSVGKYFSIDAQIANDHTRPIRFDFSPYKYDTMLDKNSWYYILRLQVNM
ncbi:MAG: hypothetical protein JWP91_4317 [Fibrobacteres bacterium]|nr:hypothetical protein [Fibrobacterota bacterium]